MKTSKTLIVMALCSMSLFSIYAQNPKEKGLNAITEQAVKGQLEFLASDWTEGRQTGERGAYMAADYIASIFNIYGLQPAGDLAYTEVSRADRRQGIRPQAYRTFYQSFNLIEYQPGDIQELAIITTNKNGSNVMKLGYKTDFSVRTSDIANEIEAPVVFVGYGMSSEKANYDDFKGIDVKGKIVLRLSGYPGHKDPTSAAAKKFKELSRYEMYYAKRDAIKESGAIAYIDVDPENDVMQYFAENLPFRVNEAAYEGEEARESYYDTRMKHPGDKLSGDLIQMSLSNRAMNELLDGCDLDIEAFEENAKTTMKPNSKELKGKSLKLKTTVNTRVVRARNVIGVIPGKDTSEIIIVGGHYDHLGIHDGWIWNGADDNGSGTVGVMTIAKAMMASGEKPEKTIVFAAWTGEEKGLLGSQYFASHPYDDAKMILNLNYDMISRDNTNDTLGNQCGLTYTKKYPVIEELTTKNITDFGLNLDIEFKASEKPRGGSDHSSFSSKDVPIFYIMAGFPPEYHQPNDQLNLINWEKMTNIIKVGYLNIYDLANTPWYKE